MRATIHLQNSPQMFRFQDSVHAALVAGLSAAGASSADLVGPAARPWSFAVKGYSRAGGESVATSSLLSSPDERIQRAMAALDVMTIRVAADNGDAIDCGGGRLAACHRMPAPGQQEIALALASPVAVARPKTGREKTALAETLDGIDVAAALKRSVEARAGRGLDLEVLVDRLAMRTDLAKRLIWLRRAPTGKRIGVPAFRFPFALRGAPEDLRFAFLAGFGAKTRQGFGLPIIAV